MSCGLLNGWKEIANYIGRSVRTVQRWESKFGLPVRRPSATDRSAVVAIRPEIDNWLANTSVKSERDSVIEVTARTAASNDRLAQTTVLVVDDNDVHSYALQRALEAVGFRVIDAGNGSDAIKRTLQQSPDVILLDVYLPDVNGYEVCKRIKSEPETAGVPVVLHSAIGPTAEDLKLAKNCGSSVFLAYPMQLQHIIANLKSCLPPTKWPKDIDRFNFTPGARVEETEHAANRIRFN